jgi:error-prone DNA polymerase
VEGLPRTQHAGLGDRPYEIPHSERQRYASYAHAPKASYVELHAHSAYSFLDGASHPEELAARAAELGYPALALTDHDGLYGSLEFAHAAKAFGVRPITGAEVTLAGGAHVTLLVENARGYANLCRLLTEAHRLTRLPGRESELLPAALDQTLLEELNEGLVCLSGCARHGLAVHDPNAAARLAAAFGRDRFSVELQRPYERGDVRRNARLRELAETIGVTTVVTGDAHAHQLSRTALQDALVAIKNRTSLEGAERERRGNREGVLLDPAEVADRFPDDRDAVARTVELAGRLEFDLTQELGYRYPDFSDGRDSADVQLARICNRAFEVRYGGANGHKRNARARLDEELALIAELKLSGFFLLHWEVLELAREVAQEVRGRDSPRHSLPPGRGRGSSVGSLVCYLTGLSHVDPVAADLSLGRFLNRELEAVPDIDLDFPRDIREKLIVGVTERYGREHAALVASFATYRSRGAIRDLGKALGLPFGELERLARVSDGWNAKRVAEELALMPEAERRLASPRWRAFGELCSEIAGLPRHVSQHPGGMVISSRPLIELVPVMPCAMAGRQMCQWDKDSCADAGFLKIDLLGLGMLSAVEEVVDQVARQHGTRSVDLSRIPLDDKDVFAEIQRADTIGDFQIESRAQMQVILRTRPETLEDIMTQVALVRPGPIQGKAIHPYIERRQKLREDPAYVPPADHPLLEEPLRATLGVVVFQDQVLDVAMALAGFTVGEAEGLRRAMSRKRSEAALEAYRDRFVEGAAGKRVAAALANEIYDKLVAFSGFGFPKSHAAAFGLLAYQSAWLRHHYPAEFLCALLNAQQMGFYPPASLVRDAQRRGVEVWPPDVNLSAAKCAVADGAVRIGLEYVDSLGEDDAAALEEEREREGPFASVVELAQRAPLSRDELEALVASGACDALGGSRRALLWELGLVPRAQSVPGSGGEEHQLALALDPTAETPELPEQTPWERMLADYRRTSLSVGVHPLELLRPHLPEGVLSSEQLREAPNRSSVVVAGLAVARQRPATANGVVFMLLEDEHGQMNLIVPPRVYERFRAVVRGEPLVLARGRFEKVGENRNVLVRELETLGPLARRLSEGDVHGSLPAAHHFGHR